MSEHHDTRQGSVVGFLYASRIELLVAAVAVAAFALAPLNGFTNDDWFIVANNPQVTQSGRWLESWSTDVWSVSMSDWSARDLLYRPLTLNSFRFVWWMTGGQAAPQIAINVLLHGLVGGLLVRLLLGWGWSRRSACIAGVAFAVLPIHTEAVVNAVARADLLAASFVLLALLAQRQAVVTADTRFARGGWPILSGVFAFAAMASKESGLAGLTAVALWEFVVRAPRAGANATSAWHARWLRLAPHVLAAALYLGLRYHALDGQWRQPVPVTRTANLLADTKGVDRVLGATQLWGMYWAKTLWPETLGIGYSENQIRLATSVFQPHAMLGAVVIAALVIWSVAAWRRGNRFVAGLGLMLAIAYGPTSNSLVLLHIFFAERIWYLPSIFLAGLLGLALERVSRVRLAAIALCLVAAALMARCWIRTPEWRNNGTLYAAAFRDQPASSHVLFLYGDWLVRNGGYEMGVELLNRAIAVDLGFTEAHRSLGWAHLHQGNIEEAVRCLQIANLQAPSHEGIATLLDEAVAALSTRTQPEIDRLREEAQADPRDLSRHIALIEAMQRTGRVAEAVAWVDERDTAFADQVKWHASVAALMIYADRRDDAVERYERALRLAPEDVQLTSELGMLLLERRAGDDVRRATELSEKAMRLAPRAPMVWVFRAEALALGGDRAGARTLYEQALKALPPDSPQRAFVAERARTLGG